MMKTSQWKSVSKWLIAAAAMYISSSLPVSAFVPGYTARQSAPIQTMWPLHATREDTETDTDGADTEALSDVDARVLRSILAEEKLDLKTEDSVKQLLERGTKPLEKPKTRTQKKEEDSGPYASQVLNTFADNSFWNSIKAKTEEIFDTAKIFIENRIERDAKLLASVGLFAWERAKRDVSRALPESGRTGAAVGRAVRNAARQLAANSSYAQYIPEDNFILPPSKYSEGVETNIFDELNTPLDEIKSVTESIRDILSGKGSGDTSSRRGLRSVAPAGTSRAAERQRRAYQRRKETVLAREKEGIDKKLRRSVESVSDAAAEIQREMAVEGNKAGYRSEKAVKALEGTAAYAMLEAGLAGEGWGQLPLGIGQRFFGARNGQKEPSRAELKEAAVIVPELTREDLLEEKARFAASLRLCLEAPEKTWLTVDAANETRRENMMINEEALRDVITTMVCIRDDLEIDDEMGGAEQSMENVIDELRQMNANVDILISLAAVAADYEAAERLKAELLGISRGDEGSIMASVDFIESEYIAAKEVKAQQEAAAAEAAAAVEAERLAHAAAEAAAFEAEMLERRSEAESAAATVVDSVATDDYSVSRPKEAQVVDAIVDADVVFEPTQKGAASVPNQRAPFFVDAVGDADIVENGVWMDGETSEAVLVDDDDAIRVIGADQVEIVMDDSDGEDFSSRNVKTAEAVTEEEASLDGAEEKELPVAAKLLLRSLDVGFFVAEKSLLALPIIVETGVTVSKRLQKESRNGLGQKGWQRLENSNSGRKRY